MIGLRGPTSVSNCSKFHKQMKTLQREKKTLNVVQSHVETAQLLHKYNLINCY